MSEQATFTDYEIRVLKELVKQTDRHFIPEPEQKPPSYSDDYKAEV